MLYYFGKMLLNVENLNISSFITNKMLQRRSKGSPELRAEGASTLPLTLRSFIHPLGWVEASSLPGNKEAMNGHE